MFCDIHGYDRYEYSAAEKSGSYIRSRIRLYIHVFYSHQQQ